MLQACFFALSGVLPKAQAIEAIKRAVKKTYASKGEQVIAANFAAIDAALSGLEEIAIPLAATALDDTTAQVPADAPAFVRQVTWPIIAGEGDALPVSAMPVDGTFPTGTTRWEKRNIADSIPVWDEVTCIQCGKCAFVCPHAAIRIKAYEPARLATAPPTFKATDYRGGEFEGMKYTIQVAPEDCTGCDLCVEVCPAKNKATGIKALEMRPQRPLRDAERENFEFFLRLPEVDRAAAKHNSVKGSQFLQPLFEFGQSRFKFGHGSTQFRQPPDENRRLSPVSHIAGGHAGDMLAGRDVFRHGRLGSDFGARAQANVSGRA